MTKRIFSIRSAAMAMAAIIASSSLLVSCLKDKYNDNPDIPVASLMAFNLSPDLRNAGFALSGSNLSTSPLAYSNYTGNYLNIYPGQRTVNAYDFNMPYNDIATAQGNFEVGKFYSVFLVGLDSNYRNIIVRDNVDSLSAISGQAFVRYINAIPDSVSVPDITITANGNAVVNTAAPFAAVSPFTAVTPGDVSIALKNSAGIDVNRTITLEQKKVYTVLLLGVPGSTSAPVEIKYISNGTLQDSTNRTAISTSHPGIN